MQSISKVLPLIGSSRSALSHTGIAVQAFRQSEATVAKGSVSRSRTQPVEPTPVVDVIPGSMDGIKRTVVLFGGT